MLKKQLKLLVITFTILFSFPFCTQASDEGSHFTISDEEIKNLFRGAYTMTTLVSWYEDSLYTVTFKREAMCALLQITQDDRKKECPIPEDIKIVSKNRIVKNSLLFYEVKFDIKKHDFPLELIIFKLS